MLITKFPAYELLLIPHKLFLPRHPKSKPVIRDLRNKTDILELRKDERKKTVYFLSVVYKGFSFKISCIVIAHNNVLFFRCLYVSFGK